MGVVGEVEGEKGRAKLSCALPSRRVLDAFQLNPRSGKGVCTASFVLPTVYFLCYWFVKSRKSDIQIVTLSGGSF